MPLSVCLVSEQNQGSRGKRPDIHPYTDKTENWRPLKCNLEKYNITKKSQHNIDVIIHQIVFAGVNPGGPEIC